MSNPKIDQEENSEFNGCQIFEKEILLYDKEFCIFHMKRSVHKKTHMLIPFKIEFDSDNMPKTQYINFFRFASDSNEEAIRYTDKLWYPIVLKNLLMKKNPECGKFETCKVGINHKISVFFIPFFSKEEAYKKYGSDIPVANKDFFGGSLELDRLVPDVPNVDSCCKPRKSVYKKSSKGWFLNSSAKFYNFDTGKVTATATDLVFRKDGIRVPVQNSIMNCCKKPSDFDLCEATVKLNQQWFDIDNHN